MRKCHADDEGEDDALTTAFAQLDGTRRDITFTKQHTLGGMQKQLCAAFGKDKRSHYASLLVKGKAFTSARCSPLAKVDRKNARHETCTVFFGPTTVHMCITKYTDRGQDIDAWRYEPDERLFQVQLGSESGASTTFLRRFPQLLDNYLLQDTFKEFKVAMRCELYERMRINFVPAYKFASHDVLPDRHVFYVADKTGEKLLDCLRLLDGFFAWLLHANEASPFRVAAYADVDGLDAEPTSAALKWFPDYIWRFDGECAPSPPPMRFYECPGPYGRNELLLTLHLIPQGPNKASVIWGGFLHPFREALNRLETPTNR